MPFQFSENRRERDSQGIHRGRSDDKHDGEHLRKLFVGGLSYETTKEELEAHFSEFGEIVDCVVMIYPDSKRSRGFGFVTFHSMTCVDAVQTSRPHYINDKEVETKRATPREKNNPRDSQMVVKKLFVGGIPEESTEDDIRTACEKHGNIVEVEIIKDRVTGKPRGFCFVTFDDYDPVDKICMLGWLQVLDKKVEVKKATPKENDRRDRFSDRRERGGGGGGGGGGYFGGGDRRGDDRYGRQDNRDRYGGGDQRRERYRSRSPVRYDRYSSGRSSSAGGGGGGYSGGMGAGNYSQSSAPPDALANLTQLAPALASLGTLVGLLSNNSGGAANSGGSNALNQLVSALGSSAGGGAATYSGDQSTGGMAPSSYADRGDNNSGYGQGNYSSGYSSSYPSYGGGGGMMQQKDDYNR